jgi:hypothetical protein
VKKGVRRFAPSRLSSMWMWSTWGIGPVYGELVARGALAFHELRSQITICTPMRWACSTSQLATASPRCCWRRRRSSGMHQVERATDAVHAEVRRVAGVLPAAVEAPSAANLGEAPAQKRRKLQRTRQARGCTLGA